MRSKLVLLHIVRFSKVLHSFESTLQSGMLAANDRSMPASCHPISGSTTGSTTLLTSSNRSQVLLQVERSTFYTASQPKKFAVLVTCR
jgi:hypothetical protein